VRVKAVLALNVALVASGVAISLHLWLRAVAPDDDFSLPQPRLTLPGQSRPVVVEFAEATPQQAQAKPRNPSPNSGGGRPQRRMPGLRLTASRGCPPAPTPPRTVCVNRLIGADRDTLGVRHTRLRRRPRAVRDPRLRPQ